MNKNQITIARMEEARTRVSSYKKLKSCKCYKNQNGLCS